MLANVSVNKFRSNLKYYVEQVADTHQPLRVTRQNTTDFIVMSVEDWEREQETLYILQNRDLMQQIADSLADEGGHRMRVEELDALDSV